MMLSDEDSDEDFMGPPFKESTEAIIYADARRQVNSNSNGPALSWTRQTPVYGSAIGSQ
jgi:hypothetical protein